MAVELMDVLQDILDKAGNKDFYIEGNIDKEDGEVRGASIRLCKVYKPENSMEKTAIASTDNDRGGTINITESDRTETNIKPAKSVAAAMKSKLKIMKE